MLDVPATLNTLAALISDPRAILRFAESSTLPSEIPVIRRSVT